MPIHKNHLIIGLGGTGGNIIRSFRKLVYQNCRKNDPANVNIRYLYADTSDELMSPEDPSWKILGHSVQLPERSQLKMGGKMNLSESLDQVASYPGISPWLGNRQAFAGILEAANAATILGSQRRRLGRFLFAAHAATFRSRISELVEQMHKANTPGVQRSTETTFHVCCGLAGGTGSGCVVDAISQIRAECPDGHNQIIVYALLPERHPAGQKAGPNYHANGYAALKELNALSVGTWHPHDIRGVSQTRLNGADAFNCCYLFNDENDAKVRVDVTRELPDIVAAFLYYKVVEIHNINWGEQTSTLLRQETYENGESRVPEFSADEKQARRARTFFSFGIKQVAYPEVEIREYLTYAFANQAALQLRYNKWVDGQGFVDAYQEQPFAEFVKEKSTLERWFLTEERLCLSEGILSDEINNRKWRAIGDFWSTIIPQYVNLVLEAEQRDVMKMMPELTRRCDEVYKEAYRGEGVENFYRTKATDMPAHAREIRSRIERDLFEEWKNGGKSMMDISRLLAALTDAIEGRIKGIDDRVGKIDEESEAVKENENSVGKNRQEWAKLGPLSRMAGKHKSILNAQAECFIKRYTLRTRVAGLRYAKTLLPAIKEELNRLASDVSKCSTMVAEAAKQFQQAVASRCQSSGDGHEIDFKTDFSRQVVQFYDPKGVRSFSQVLITNPQEQKRQTAKVRAELVRLLGDNPTFASFQNRITKGKFVDVLESFCEESAIEAHEEYVARNPDRGRVLKVSLIDQMRKEFEGNDEKLRTYVRNVVEMSSDFLKLDGQQIMLVQPGIRIANDPANAVAQANLTIIVPEEPDAKDFREHVCEAFKQGSKAEKQQVVSNAGRSQEITAINITNGFSARMVGVVGFLKERYVARLAETKDGRAFMELHLEGESGARLPDGQEIFDLYPEAYTSADFRPWIMLAEAFGLIRAAKDARTGNEEVNLYSLDPEGFETPTKLGPSIEWVTANPNPVNVEMVKAAVSTRLATDYVHKVKRDELLNEIRTSVQSRIQGLASNDPLYIAQREGFTKVKDLLDAGR